MIDDLPDLRAHRLARGYTRQRVADELCVSLRTYTRWETDPARISATGLLILAVLYRCSVEDLFRKPCTEEMIG